MTLYDDYVLVLEEQSKLYGPTTIVLYQVGTFWEILDCDEHRGCDVPTIARILNIQVTRRNKSIPEVSRTNNCLAGFNVTSLSKYLPILVAALYTIVLVSEVGGGGKSNAAVIRQVTRVVSKGTWMEDPSPHPVSQRIACLYLQSDKPATRVTGCGFASLDLHTGQSEALEVGSVDGMDAFDFICTKVSGLCITELLITGDGVGVDTSRLHVHNMGLVHDLSAKPNGLDNPAVQELILKKAYPRTGFLTGAEFVGLERSAMALTAFVNLLDFTHRHDETILSNLSVPTSCETSGLVSLSPTTLNDVDITCTDGSRKCLANLLNGCSTGMGKRLFHHRLTCPIVSLDELQVRHDAVDQMLTMGWHTAVHQGLKSTCDIERAWRRVTTRLSAKSGGGDVLLLRNSLIKIGEVFRACHSNVGDTDVVAMLECFEIIDIDGQIRAGAFPDVDAARTLVESYASAADVWMDAVHDRLGPGRAHYVKPAPNDDPCAHASCTVKRFGEVLAIVGPDLAMMLDENSSRVRFTGVNIRQSAAECASARLELELVVSKRWKHMVNGWCLTENDRLARIVCLTALLDVHACIATDAQKNDLVRPIVSDGAISAVSCTGLRHPLAERMQQQTEYIANDVTLDSGGILLYGVNASGKSTLGKALALAVLMCQAGMFVACKHMSIVPFRNVLTRMASRDDIYYGRSTFMVELMELRNILSRADSRTLIIGDELCSGTESASAISIVGAMCQQLVEVKSSFILATHLHELSRLSQTASHPHIQIFHLGVTYDHASDELRYDRKLREGPGKALYGLEVARAMHMPLRFMEKAHEIRREILGIDHSLAQIRPSHFNKAVFLDVCGLCGSRAEETHHIVPQHLADGQGRLQAQSAAFHKNIRHNLVPLCQACHKDVHADRVVVEGYISTSSGVRLLASNVF